MMKVQIDGVNTQNKGAELMLVAILEEIESRFPGSKIAINPDSAFNKAFLDNYKLNIKRRGGLKFSRYIKAIAKRLKYHGDLGYFGEHYSGKQTTLLLDASGFKYSDQWNRSKDWLDTKEKYYAKVKKNGTKLCFLTQAFGPFETPNGKRSVEILTRFCDLIFAREQKSYEYLINAGANPAKVIRSCDFTFKVKGVVPEKYSSLNGKVAVIPNYKMITHGGYKSSEYKDFLIKIISYLRSIGKGVFLLNHEGKNDLALCLELKDAFEADIEVVSGLSAKEVKGIIGISSLVVSSRFHGVASALSQDVPCLATSWNHKYEMLFNDFGQKDNLISAHDMWSANKAKLDYQISSYKEIKNVLKERKIQLLKEIEEMWDLIFRKHEI